MNEHDCFEGENAHYTRFDSEPLLETTHWEFEIETCKACGKRYLRAFSESNGFSGSGRWFMGKISPSAAFENPKEQHLLKQLYDTDRLFCGGSYWGSKGFWSEKHPRMPVYMHLKQAIY